MAPVLLGDPHSAAALSASCWDKGWEPGAVDAVVPGAGLVGRDRASAAALLGLLKWVFGVDGAAAGPGGGWLWGLCGWGIVVAACGSSPSLWLSWDEPVSLAEQVTGYRILRRSPSLGQYRLGELVADTGSTLTVYRDTDVASSTAYVYRVVALRGGVAAPRSNKAKLTYQPPAVSPEAPEESEALEVPEVSGQLRDDAGAPVTAKEPAWTRRQLAPTGLVAEAGPGFVVLAWDAPAGDADAVDGYEILRRRVNRGEKVLLTLVADTGTADTSYVDRSANEEGVKYAYRVKALRDATASVWSMFTNAVGQANSVEFVEGPEPELETGEQHDDATEYSDRAVYGIDFDFDCNRSYPYEGFRLRDESLTGYDSAPYFENNNPYIKRAAAADGTLLSQRKPRRLRSLRIFPHTASQRNPSQRPSHLARESVHRKLGGRDRAGDYRGCGAAQRQPRTHRVSGRE